MQRIPGRYQTRHESPVLRFSTRIPEWPGADEIESQGKKFQRQNCFQCGRVCWLTPDETHHRCPTCRAAGDREGYWRDHCQHLNDKDCPRSEASYHGDGADGDWEG